MRTARWFSFVKRLFVYKKHDLVMSVFKRLLIMIRRLIRVVVKFLIAFDILKSMLHVWLRSVVNHLCQKLARLFQNNRTLYACSASYSMRASDWPRTWWRRACVVDQKIFFTPLPSYKKNFYPTFQNKANNLINNWGNHSSWNKFHRCPRRP